MPLDQRTGKGTLYGFLAFLERNKLGGSLNTDGSVTVDFPDGNKISDTPEGGNYEPLKQKTILKLIELDIIPLP